MTISDEIKSHPAYKKTLKDERTKRMLILYVAIAITVTLVLLAFALKQIDGTTKTIERTQQERTVDGQKSIRIAVSAAVACAASEKDLTYEALSVCVNKTVDKYDPQQIGK